jgi:hypothetical protein
MRKSENDFFDKTEYIVACRPVARQQMRNATIELLEEVFSMRSVPRCY